MEPYYQAISRLPGFVHQSLCSVPSHLADQVQEIRLRTGRPVVFTTKEGILPAVEWTTAHSIPPLTHPQVKQCFYELCDRSVHTHQQQLAQGFFTIPGGHRVGVAGSFCWAQDEIKGIQSITSLNIRVARIIQIPLPNALKSQLQQPFRGMLLIGPPGSGKTTLLRSLVSHLCARGKRVCVVDEREEIWPCSEEGFQYLPPLHCDVLSGVQKNRGIQNALRSMGPDIIVCDEIAGHSEWQQIKAACSGGIEFLCTIHGTSVQDAEQRLECGKGELSHYFGLCVLLPREMARGRIQEVVCL